MQEAKRAQNVGLGSSVCVGLPLGWDAEPVGPPREVRLLRAPGGAAPKATCAQCNGDKGAAGTILVKVGFLPPP